MLVVVATLLTGCKAHPLDGTSWTLVSMNGHELLPGPRSITAIFTHTGITGSTGCNQYGFPVEVEADKLLLLDGGGVTEVLCREPEGIMDQQRDYLQTLEQVSSYNNADGRLALYDSSGQPILEYREGLPEGYPGQ